MKDNFKKQNERFLALLKSIQKKEKIHLQTRQSLRSPDSTKSNISAYQPIGETNGFVAGEM